MIYADRKNQQFVYFFNRQQIYYNILKYFKTNTKLKDYFHIVLNLEHIKLIRTIFSVISSETYINLLT